VPKATLIAFCALLVAAGCGESQRGAVERVLARSPQTYLHYRDRVWWGRSVRISVAVRVSHDVATARVLVMPAADPLDAQRVVLHRRNGRWRFVGRSAALVRGPRATRSATAAERRAIVGDARRRIFQGHDRCVHYAIGISRVDERYAIVGYEFRKPYLDCRLGNGESLFLRRAGGAWRELSEASDGWDCVAAPPGVIRSLAGSCWVAR
jgi:hypothetical protein